MSRYSEAVALAAWVAGALATTGPRIAQAQPAPPSEQLQRVEITGSSIKRIDAETALPLQIITRDQIQKSGATNVEQLMQVVPAISSSGGITVSSGAGATTGAISAVSLHGLTSLRTLVLVNGRRVAPYGIGFTGDAVSVDVNSIPVSAIERVEILKDGASAIYGSDAIAGVINFILRQDFHGAEVTAEYGSTSRGGANFKRVAGTFGAGNLAGDRYNLLLSINLQKEGALFGRDRAFASSGINPINDTSSGNTFPANIAAADGSFGSGNPTAATGCQLPYAQPDPNRDPATCRFDPAPLVSLVPAAERASLFAAGRYALTNDLQAFVEASYSRNSTRTVFQPVPISDQFNIPANNPLFGVAPYNGFSTIILQSTSPYYPTAYVKSLSGGPTPDLLVRYRSAVTGNRDVTDVSEAPRAVVGIKGSVGGWDVDAAGLYTQNKLTEHDNGGWPLLTKIMPLLNSGNVNFFGPNTPDIDAALLATNFNDDAFVIRTSIASLAARASRDAWQLPAGPVGVAFGVEGRREKYAFEGAPAINQGDVAGYGGNFANVDRSRGVGAVFAEVTLPLARRLEADLAVRYDHYEGVGGAVTPKASLRWQPAPQVLFRGSFGQGFRAPSLADLFSPATTGVTQQGLTDPIRCPVTGDGVKDCATQFPTTVGGSPGLRPEKSNNLTLGTVLEPSRDVSISIDYFRILLKDAISNGIGASFILNDPVKYARYITRGPADPAFPTLPGPITNIDLTNLNLGNEKVAGFEVDLKWRLPTSDLGRFTFNFDGTYISRFDTSNPDGTYSSVIDAANPATGGVVPRLRTRAGVDWAMGPWSVTFAQNFQKGYDDLPGTETGASRHVGSYLTYDLQASYQRGKAWRLTLGARNLFDRDPPYSNSGGQTSFQSGYDNQYGDPRGRFVYARVTYTIP